MPLAAAAQLKQPTGALTAEVAHDFNNLLGIIIANLDLLAERRTDSTDDTHSSTKR